MRLYEEQFRSWIDQNYGKVFVVDTTLPGNEKEVDGEEVSYSAWLRQYIPHQYEFFYEEYRLQKETEWRDEIDLLDRSNV